MKQLRCKYCNHVIVEGQFCQIGCQMLYAKRQAIERFCVRCKKKLKKLEDDYCYKCKQEVSCYVPFIL